MNTYSILELWTKSGQTYSFKKSSKHSPVTVTFALGGQVLYSEDVSYSLAQDMIRHLRDAEFEEVK